MKHPGRHQNKRSHKLITLTLLLVLLLAVISACTGPEGKDPEPFPEVTYQVVEPAVPANYAHKDVLSGALVGDYGSGKILHAANVDKLMPIASMSKLMTYYVVMEDVRRGHLSMDEEIEITPEAARFATPGNSNFGLKAGMRLTVRELLKGMMVVSGNDAATALAIRSAGSEEKFVARMNEAAEILDLRQSKFVNPTGLNMATESGDQQNSMTLRELFALARILIHQFPEILEYGGIRTIEDKSRGYVGTSTFPLKNSYPYIDGLKTGYTREAGYCFAATLDMVNRNKIADYRAIIIVTGAPDKQIRMEAMRDLIEWAGVLGVVKR